MGTSNFYNKNASRIFACEIEEEWKYEDLIDNLIWELETIKDFQSEIEDKWETNGLRSFPGRILGGFKRWFICNEYEYGVEIDAIVRSGYYSGVNLDYDIGITEDGYDFDPENSYDIEDLNEKHGSTNDVLERITKLKTDMIEEIEKVFKENSTPLIVAARFSNGETIYEEVG